MESPIGKRCTVWFVNQEPGSIGVEGTLRYTPAGEGDVWAVEEDDGTIHFVQHFEEIVVKPEAKQ